MQNKSFPEAKVEVRTENDQKDEPPIDSFWLASVALLVSIASFVRTHFSDRQSRKYKVGQDFENKYGSEVRDRIRSLERSIKTLRAFGFPSNRSVDADISELAEKKIEWFDAADEVLSILREVDLCVGLKEPHWYDAFKEYSDDAEFCVNSICIERITDHFALNSYASDAYSKYESGIVMLRERLTDQTESISSVKLQKKH